MRNKSRRCPTCGKVSFRTWDDASHAALCNSARWSKPFRVYSCNDGGKIWHTTTTPDVVK